MRAWFLLLLAGAVQAHTGSPTAETRYCGPPERTASGEIRRRPDVRAAFQRLHPCPSTGAAAGSCPGWSVDHVIPLASCGCDSVSNMQWLPNGMKSAAGALPKDRWERRVYVCGRGDRAALWETAK